MTSTLIFEINVDGQVSTNSGRRTILNWRYILERRFASLHFISLEKRKLSVELKFWLAPERICHMQKNDLDNLSKPVLDAMKRIGIIHDDAEIFHMEIRKLATKGEEGVYVMVRELLT